MQFISNNKQFTVSIIVPVYNVEQYLQKCIDSLISQTYNNIEIILVDDGSTDKSSIICDENAKQDCRIKVFHKANGGLSDARNTGLENASGEFIIFIDSDDYLYDKSAIQLFVEKQIETNCNIIIGRIFTLQNEKLEPTTKNDYVSLKDAFCDVTIFSACNKLIKKSVLNNRRFILKRVNEDVSFTSEILFNNTVQFLNYPTYVYVQRTQSIQHSFNEKHFDMIKSVKDSFNNLEKSNLEKELYKYAKYNLCLLQLGGLLFEIIQKSKKREIVQGVKKFLSYLEEYNLKNDFYKYYFIGQMKIKKISFKTILKYSILIFVLIIDLIN